MSKPFGAILIGADSDLPVMEAGCGVQDKFDIAFAVKVTSAQHTPFARNAQLRRDLQQRQAG